jgi:hypothetical protein
VGGEGDASVFKLDVDKDCEGEGLRDAGSSEAVGAALMYAVIALFQPQRMSSASVVMLL